MSRKFRLAYAIFCIAVVLLPAVPIAGDGNTTANAASEQAHGPVCAGTWYPGTPGELKNQIEAYLDKVPARDPGGQIMALVAPHAGYMYSGQVAANSYKPLRGKSFETVIVIGPSHHVAFPGVATYDCAGFGTPLGSIPLDNRLIADLKKREPRIKDYPAAFAREHSLEMQLPFLQTVMPGFKLVPLLMGEHDYTTSKWLAEAIAACIKGKSVLVVASSDLSHFHSYETAKEIDGRLVERLRAMDAAALADCLDEGKCEACGRGPVTAAMLVAANLGATGCKVLEYANSGDVTGDKNSPRGVVGYCAAVFYKGAGDRDAVQSTTVKPGIDLGLSEQERAELHALARKVIEARCRGIDAPKCETASQKLKQPSGVFVTVYKNGELRGCIGHVIARKPLVEAVSEMAEAAAFQDPRFTPVRRDELGDLKIEISVLTPLQKIQSPEEIEVGKHGLIIKQGGSMGLLLPQVATEYGWDRTAFLENTCRKAGLPRNAWKEKDAEIFVFSADVF